MTRWKLVAVAILSVLIVIAAITVTRHFRMKAIPGAEIALTRLTPALPPEYSCDQVSRVLDVEPELKPVLNSEPLSADETAIYETILLHRKPQRNSRLNLSQNTYPFQRVHVSCECLNGIDVQSARNASRSFHILGRELAGLEGVHLIRPESQRDLISANDPANTIGTGLSTDTAVRRAYEAGLFSVSEIAFDPDHRRALVSYSFVCGGLCGNGRTLLVDKIDGVWKINEMTCGGWIS